MSLLATRLIEIHDALTTARFPHAFGGAIALAYCTHEPRGTRDLDMNIFVAPARVREVFEALPEGIAITSENIESAERDGQVRLWWEDTPIDVFLDTLRLHREVARTVRMVPFADRTIPVVSCTALAIFKALFDRTRDWADIEAMVDAGSVDMADARKWIVEIAGIDSTPAQRMGTFPQS